MLPILNNPGGRFTSRDNLGINSATSAMQAQLCPVVTTVTPRAFYWPFLVWNYYEYYQIYGAKNPDPTYFENEFLKRNDYFFVLGNLLTPSSDKDGLVGKDNANRDINEAKKKYSYNKKYFLARYGGMQYYISGCDTLGFVTSVDDSGRTYKLPLLTENMGKPMAQAFEEVINKTRYYKLYRTGEMDVPTEVLIELGSVIGLSMSHLQECKRLLKQALFEPRSNQRLNNSRLIASSELVKFIHDVYGEEDHSSTLRNLLYQVFPERGDNNSVPEELIPIASQWEVVVGRQYMTLAIELIWKELLTHLYRPVPMSVWIENTIKQSTITSVDLSLCLGQAVLKENLSSIDIENMIKKGYRRRSCNGNIERSVRILFSLYNRFKERDDIALDDLSYGFDVSLLKLLALIADNPQMTVHDFLVRVMNEWILKKHLLVAREKMMRSSDGYYFSITDGICYKLHDAEPDFQGNRLIQLAQVMKDLEML